MKRDPLTRTVWISSSPIDIKFICHLMEFTALPCERRCDIILSAKIPPTPKFRQVELCKFVASSSIGILTNKTRRIRARNARTNACTSMHSCYIELLFVGISVDLSEIVKFGPKGNAKICKGQVKGVGVCEVITKVISISHRTYPGTGCLLKICSTDFF